MERKDFINFIPKPENKDVILYDISLKDLIDVDVLEEYNKLYPIFNSKKTQYIELKTSLDEYEKSITNIYLFNKNWTEQDYLISLQNSKKTYSTLFKEIKKIENNISMFQRNLKTINEKINIQKSKDAKNIEDRKNNLDKTISQNKDQLLSLTNYLDTYTFSLNQIEEQLKNNEEEFQMLSIMESKLQDGKCKCEMCGHTITSMGEGSYFYNRLCKNIEKNKNNLEKLLAKKEKIEANVGYYKSEVKKVRTELNNDIQFRKEANNFYQKKSTELLKLESNRDIILNNIADLEKQLKNNSQTKSKQYLELKKNIEKCELSINNLNKVKELKANHVEEIKMFTELKEELKEMLSKMELYIKFINIYFKIIEQKASEFCGSKFKFKFFKLENYKLELILEIYYEDVEISQLPQKTKYEVDKYLAEKFEIFS